MSLADIDPRHFVFKKPKRTAQKKNVKLAAPAESQPELEPKQVLGPVIPTIITNRTRHERNRTVIGDLNDNGGNIILPIFSSKMPLGFLWKLSLQQRQTIAQNRPARVYDILPNDMKSQSFIVQFDMENPSNRFLIIHRAVVQSYDALSDLEKRELVHVALSFVKRFELVDSFLSIPQGINNHVGVIYPTFYAHIIVSDSRQYLKVFKEFTSEEKIPSWPGDKRWVTPLWASGSADNPTFESFKETVKANTSTYPNMDVLLLSKRKVISHVPALNSANKHHKLCKDFKEVISKDHSLIGIYSYDFVHHNCNELERCQYLDCMNSIMRKQILRHPYTNCSLRISLGSRIVLQDKIKVIGFIKFNSKIPSHFLESKPKGLSENYNYSTKLKLILLSDTRSDCSSRSERHGSVISIKSTKSAVQKTEQRGTINLSANFSKLRINSAPNSRRGSVVSAFTYNPMVSTTSKISSTSSEVSSPISIRIEKAADSVESSPVTLRSMRSSNPNAYEEESVITSFHKPTERSTKVENESDKFGSKVSKEKIGGGKFTVPYASTLRGAAGNSVSAAKSNRTQARRNGAISGESMSSHSPDLLDIGICSGVCRQIKREARILFK